MGMFLKLIAVLKVAMPLPNWEDAPAILAWWEGLGAPMADLIASLAEQAKTRGEINIALPMGGPILAFSLTPGADFSMLEDLEELARALETHPDLAGKFGDGKILEFLTQLIPLILQILPLFLKKAEPKPPPVV